MDIASTATPDRLVATELGLRTFARRQMGVLLHPTSLPGRHGGGDLGPEARRFVDWLARAGASVWQMLPTTPPGGPTEDIPYATWASLANNPYLISLDDLHEDGLLTAGDLAEAATFEEGWLRVPDTATAKATMVARAVERLYADPRWAEAVAEFRAGAPWVVDVGRYAALRQAHDVGWWGWPDGVRQRTPAALAEVDRAFEPAVRSWVGRQFLFERQWARLRAYATERGVALLGDIPIYVGLDSVDVWTAPHGWQLDADRQPVAVCGAPPDMFAAEGQNWGAPLYDWDRMAEDDFAWWRLRLVRTFAHFDAARIDHFRAFSAYWSIPAEARSARDGTWRPGPGQAFFTTVERHLGRLPLCAEDLGTIDDDVRALLAAIDVPGMKILHYAFGEHAGNPYLPHNVPERAVVYPGNHDNDTTMGWWHSLPPHVRAHVQHYLGRDGHDIAWDLVREALRCPAQLAVVQMQDLLSLPGWARMNDPGSYDRPVEEWDNWRWRLFPGQASDEVADRLRFLGTMYSRC